MPHREESGAVAVELSANGIDFVLSEEEYEYLEPSSLLQVKPSRGPGRGGSLVTVIGAGFPDTRDLQCGFGRSFSSSEHAVASEARRISSSMVECSTPSHVAGNASLSVLYNKIPVSSDVLYYLFEMPLSVSLLEPCIGAQEGGDMVTVSGSGFSGVLQKW